MTRRVIMTMLLLIAWSSTPMLGLNAADAERPAAFSFTCIGQAQAEIVGIIYLTKSTVRFSNACYRAEALAAWPEILATMGEVLKITAAMQVVTVGSSTPANFCDFITTNNVITGRCFANTNGIDAVEVLISVPNP